MKCDKPCRKLESAAMLQRRLGLVLAVTSYLGVPKVGSLIGSKTISLLLASTMLFSPAIQGLMLKGAGSVVQCLSIQAGAMCNAWRPGRHCQPCVGRTRPQVNQLCRTWPCRAPAGTASHIQTHQSQACPRPLQ